MSLVWAEPFDQYGGTFGIVTNSGYATVPGGNVNSPGRTGLYSLNISGGGYLTRALDNPGVSTLGQGVALNLKTNNGNNSNNTAIEFLFAAGNPIKIVQLGDLSLGVYDTTNTLKAQTPPNQIIMNTWVWVEAVVMQNVGGVVNTGYCEIRINGIQQLVVNGLNVPNPFTGHGIGSGGFVNSNCLYDDWIVWNGLGAHNNTFMGDRRLFVSYPDANGAQQDFTPSAGSAFDCVNNAPPVDTTYIAGAAAGDVSEFLKDPIGINSNDIAAIVVGGRLFKSDAGVASGRIGIDSNGNVVNSPAISPGTTGTYYYSINELDPDGNVPWTEVSANAANIVITRDS